MYRSILVPHAGTKAGDKALDHAKKIAKTNDSEITILHIIENIPIPPTITFSIERKELAKEIKQARTDMKKEMHKTLDKKAERLRNQGIPTTVKVLHGYPDEEITRIANENHFDVVVMAKRRKLPGLKAILKLGSVSRKVLERIPCPVLLIDGERR
jgi:nucleotide-binding universal stress UspA family protein